MMDSLIIDSITLHTANVEHNRLVIPRVRDFTFLENGNHVGVLKNVSSLSSSFTA